MQHDYGLPESLTIRSPRKGTGHNLTGEAGQACRLHNEIADIHTRNPNLKEPVGSVYSHRFVDARAVLGPLLQADKLVPTRGAPRDGKADA